MTWLVRFVAGILLIVAVSGCGSASYQINWHDGETDWGDWNNTLHVSFPWKTKYAVQGKSSRRLLPKCALVVVPVVEAHSFLKPLTKGEDVDRPWPFFVDQGIFSPCYDDFDGLSFPDSCQGADVQIYFSPKGVEAFTVGVCFRQLDAVVHASRNVGLRS